MLMCLASASVRNLTFGLVVTSSTPSLSLYISLSKTYSYITSVIGMIFVDFKTYTKMLIDITQQGC